MGLFDALLGNASASDPAAVQRELAPILIQGEQVQVAFKLIRDLVVFTSKRLIFVDKQGLTGSKTSFLSIPYKKITRFSAETAGFADADAELRIWVGNSVEPTLTLEINRQVPVQAVYQTLSWYILQ